MLMRFDQLTKLMKETRLSPERLARYLRISNVTYRRWLKRRPQDEVPHEYERNIAGGVYQLLAEGKLDHDSRIVAKFVEDHLPEVFHAAIRQFDVPAGLAHERTKHQDKITAVLSHIGSNTNIRAKVDKNALQVRKFASWGWEWKSRVVPLVKVIRSKKLGAMDKFVAYGALFYLILPFDLIPDSIPIFGYVDDFGILSFAVAYYLRKYPTFFKDSERETGSMALGAG